MNISAVSNRNSYNMAFNKNNEEEKNNIKSLTIKPSKNNAMMQALEKTKENLLKQKEKLQQEEMTPEEKKFKMEEINKQISEIEEQIYQAKLIEKEKELEKIKEEVEKRKQESEKHKEEENNGVIVADSLKELIAAKQHLDNTHDMKVTKTNMKVELGYLQDVKSPGAFVSKQKEKLQKGIYGLENRINVEIGKSNKKVNGSKEKEKEKDTTEFDIEKEKNTKTEKRNEAKVEKSEKKPVDKE